MGIFPSVGSRTSSLSFIWNFVNASDQLTPPPTLLHRPTSPTRSFLSGTAPHSQTGEEVWYSIRGRIYKYCLRCNIPVSSQYRSWRRWSHYHDNDRRFGDRWSERHLWRWIYREEEVFFLYNQTLLVNLAPVGPIKSLSRRRKAIRPAVSSLNIMRRPAYAPTPTHRQLQLQFALRHRTRVTL